MATDAGLTLARPKQGLVAVFFAMLILAAGTELLQGFSIDRNPGLNDVAIDLTGAAIGTFLAAATHKKWPADHHGG